MEKVLYSCDHPVYSKCTLITNGIKGIAVIQQRFNATYKYTWWGPIDSDICEMILQSKYLEDYFNDNATEPDENGLYFTIEVRKLMWSLKMKALKKPFWETRF